MHRTEHGYFDDVEVFEGPTDLGKVRAVLKKYNKKDIVIRCHYRKPWKKLENGLGQSPRFLHREGIIEKEPDGNFTLNMGKIRYRRIDMEIAEMRPVNPEGEFYGKEGYVCIKMRGIEGFERFLKETQKAKT